MKPHCDLLSISHTWSASFHLQSSFPPNLELRLLSCVEVYYWVSPYFGWFFLSFLEFSFLYLWGCPPPGEDKHISQTQACSVPERPALAIWWLSLHTGSLAERTQQWSLPRFLPFKGRYSKFPHLWSEGIEPDISPQGPFWCWHFVASDSLLG